MNFREYQDSQGITTVQHKDTNVDVIVRGTCKTVDTNIIIKK